MKPEFPFFSSHLISRFLPLSVSGIRLHSQLCKQPGILEAYFKSYLPKFIPKLQENEKENTGQNQNGSGKATSNVVWVLGLSESCHVLVLQLSDRPRVKRWLPHSGASKPSHVEKMRSKKSNKKKTMKKGTDNLDFCHRERKAISSENLSLAQPDLDSQ